MTGGLPTQIGIGNTTHSLTHLSPFIYTYLGHGEEKGDLRIRVSFTSHVFSVDSNDLNAFDFKDKNDNGRFFCPQRYAVSLSLADNIKTMLNANAWSWKMKDKNGYSNLGILAKEVPKLINGTYNVIIYYFFPSPRENVEVEMVVMSCYLRPINFANHTTRSRIRTLAKESFFSKVRVPKN